MMKSSHALVLSFVLGSPSFGQTETAKAPPATTMKAIRQYGHGGPEVLKYEDAPKPSAKAGEVLIAIHAAAVNPVDWKLREGRRGGNASGGTTEPTIPGFDVAGVIESVGQGVTKFKRGDEVFAMTSLRLGAGGGGTGGAYAEYVAVSDNQVAKKPANVDFEHAAAVPLAALTAWQALFETAKLSQGQTVLIHAGAGGVGHFAVQMAKARGAKVIATASSTENLAFLKQIGADVIINYKEQKFEDVAKEVDVVLDTIAGETQERSFACLKEGGFLVSILQQPDAEKLKQHKVRGAVMLVKPNGTQLSEIATLIEAGKIKPEVSATFPLTEAGKAQELSKAGHVRGKIALKVR
jgi:NADPH:quinone reductase-like Zn-dependent oxidoreductase